MKVLAGGCFNSLHPGHEYFLKKARSLGDFLLVVISNDINNKKPYAKPASERADALKKLGIADKIVVGEAEDFSAVVRNEKPDIIALGYDQVLLEKTASEVAKHGIKIARIGKFGDYSTRKILKGKSA